MAFDLDLRKQNLIANPEGTKQRSTHQDSFNEGETDGVCNRPGHLLKSLSPQNTTLPTPTTACHDLVPGPHVNSLEFSEEAKDGVSEPSSSSPKKSFLKGRNYLKSL